MHAFRILLISPRTTALCLGGNLRPACKIGVSSINFKACDTATSAGLRSFSDYATILIFLIQPSMQSPYFFLIRLSIDM